MQWRRRARRSPTIDTSGVGVAVKANKAVTISLKSLTAGAKDIYIKVKNDDKYSDVKISDTLKITIPDYDPDQDRLHHRDASVSRRNYFCR